MNISTHHKSVTSLGAELLKSLNIDSSSLPRSSSSNTGAPATILRYCFTAASYDQDANDMQQAASSGMGGWSCGCFAIPKIDSRRQSVSSYINKCRLIKQFSLEVASSTLQHC